MLVERFGDVVVDVGSAVAWMLMLVLDDEMFGRTYRVFKYLITIPMSMVA